MLLTLCGLNMGCAQKPSVQAQTPDTTDKKNTSLVIAFGSCNKQYLSQPLWKEIIKNKPKLWLWLGDNIYGDTQDMGVMKRKYDQQLANSGYQELVKNTEVAGTWDDHDYGVNDGGTEYAKKKESQQLMLDFLGYPKDAPIRQQEGVYSSRTLSKDGHNVKVILLDSRYFRDQLQRIDGVYQPNSTGTILGEKQWKWLEQELTNSKADVHMIGCGIQFIPEDHRFEKWANFPNERTRLFKLIAKTKAKNVVFISGDRHIAEVSKYKGALSEKPIYEVTASGLTHFWSSSTPEVNRYRQGDLIMALNFGVFEFKFGDKPELIARIKGLNNKTLLQTTIPLVK